MQKTYPKTIITKRLIQLQGKKTLRVFAEQIGIGQSTLHNYLRGRPMRDKTIKLICIKTGCTADWLLGLKPTEPNANADIQNAELKMYIAAGMEEDKKLLESMEE
jgi:transcriptional regulator with XRE-family HTH domain